MVLHALIVIQAHRREIGWHARCTTQVQTKRFVLDQIKGQVGAVVTGAIDGATIRVGGLACK